MEDQKQIKINGIELLAVQVPEGASRFILINTYLWYREPGGSTNGFVDLKSEDYEIIGLVGDEYLYTAKLAGISLEYSEPGDFDDIAKDVAKFKEKLGLKDNTLLLKKL